MHKDDMNNRSIEEILRNRAKPPAMRAHLTARIIAAATGLPQKKALSIAQGISDVFKEFAMPRPAFALLAVLVVGFIVGVTDNISDDAASFSPSDTLFSDEVDQ
jgi:hypothetical protein